jgi:hypothetical protein
MFISNFSDINFWISLLVGFLDLDFSHMLGPVLYHYVLGAVYSKSIMSTLVLVSCIDVDEMDLSY